MCNLAWFFLGAFIGSTITLVGMVIIMNRGDKEDDDND